MVMFCLSSSKYIELILLTWDDLAVTWEESNFLTQIFLLKFSDSNFQIQISRLKFTDTDILIKISKPSVWLNENESKVDYLAMTFIDLVITS